ncbi:hypothetical protein [Stenotrophomonas sp. MMGLT7]|uniref:hypothetical protein n=1 Tax=Stenotrophomonas sp. MMGLT7 TaxID=2901227 RepID=UPI001E494913|nr:hypothetical protein [Stenotrophomonas sp. MMGLT7]MCD7099115.1 hypothetical protein [Stenotrophomonas sp. MMGLT7]
MSSFIVRRDNFKHSGKHVPRGQVVDLTDAQAAPLLLRGAIRPAPVKTAPLPSASVDEGTAPNTESAADQEGTSVMDDASNDAAPGLESQAGDAPAIESADPNPNTESDDDDGSQEGTSATDGASDDDAPAPVSSSKTPAKPRKTTAKAKAKG